MELKEGTRVYSADGEEVGKINRLILYPVSKKMTHIVVEKGLFFPEDKVVPIEWVASAQPDRVTLTKNSNTIQDLPPFEELHYIPLDETERRDFAYAPYEYVPSYYWYPPYGTPAYANSLYPSNMTVEKERNIPKNAIPLKEGADVISADGSHIGDVERLFADPQTNRSTHLLISQGLLLKEKKLIPVEWVNAVDEDKVHLAVGAKMIERLPDYQT